MKELEIRTATVAAVSFPERMIELVVMPYESETMVEHHGRMVREIVSRGAFGNIRADHHRVNVNRDHHVSMVVGKAVAFYPERDEGLVADCRIAKTDMGEETLQLAEEGCLDASAGFAIEPGGERWEEGMTRRRINKAWLAHIAMTPDPAYRDARVLSVRSTGATRGDTPNLDQVRAWRLQATYDAMERTR